MNTLNIVLNLLVIQGVLGAFDTIYHHELRAALPQQPGAGLELRIHAIRSVLYGVVFAGLAWFAWGGVWLVVLGIIVLIEVVLTLWDFLVEDRTRLLPQSERVLHTVLAINSGAAFGLLCLHAPIWWALPTGLHPVFQGWQSVVLSVFAIGVAASGVRDAFANRALGRRLNQIANVRFDGPAKHVLITGGTGFIGQVLCRALLATGHEITLLTRDPIKCAYLFNGRARCVTQLTELDPATRVDVVINLAGERIVGPRWTEARRQALIASRVGTTRALVDWISKARTKPKLMISASAVGYYGVQAPDDTRTLSEDAAGQGVFVSELCQLWETAARAVTRHRVPLALLRLGLVFGHQGVLPGMRLPFMLGLGGPIGTGRQAMSWVHIDDVLGVIAHLMNSDPARAAGVYNVTAPQTVTQADFARTLGRVWHRPSLLTMPGTLFRAVLGEQATLMLDGQRVYPTRLEQSGYRFLFPRLETALTNLRGATP
ncbi:MAG TPA: TIGR01777 family oxidoreductase [Burkholderiales bacterium]